MVPSEGSSAIASTSERDSYVVTALSDVTDRALHAALARFTLGLPPATIAAAYLDWLVHLMAAPGKRLQLIDKMARKSIRFADFVWQQAAAAAMVAQRDIRNSGRGASS